MSMKIHQIHKFIGIKTEVKSQLPIHIGMLNHLWKVSMWILSFRVKQPHTCSCSWTVGWSWIGLAAVWRWSQVVLLLNNGTSPNTQCVHYKQIIVPDSRGWSLDMAPNFCQYWHFCGTIINICTYGNPYKMGTPHQFKKMRCV